MSRKFLQKRGKYGTETVMYRAPSLWTNLHTKYKNAKSFDEFQSKIKAWKCLKEIFKIISN